jgi:hypothetical protein
LITLKLNLKNKSVSGVGLSGSGQGLITGSCEYSNEPLVSIDDKEFPEELSTCQLLKQTLLHELLSSDWWIWKY